MTPSRLQNFLLSFGMALSAVVMLVALYAMLWGFATLVQSLD